MQPGNRSGNEIARAWFWVAAWIAVVQTFASDAFAARETTLVIGPVLRWLFPGVDDDSVAAIHFAIRKVSHFVEYAVLAWLASRAFRVSFDRPLAWVAAASLALALAVAVVDEVRQSSAENRTGAASDVALDMSGAAAALVLVAVTRRLGKVRT